MKGLLKNFLLILSFVVAIWAYIIARQAITAVKTIERPEIKPKIELQTEFHLILNNPPHITVKNCGPVDVSNVNIKFHSLKYEPLAKMISVAFSQADWEWEIADLKTSESRSFNLPASLLGRNARSQEPVRHNILEASIKYSRGDGKEFEQRAFYFVNPEGRWVDEADDSIIDKEYYEIKEAVLSTLAPRSKEKRNSDLLHFVRD